VKPVVAAARSPERSGSLADSTRALGVALLVVAGFCSAAQTAPPLALAWAAAFLFLAVESDVRTRRIPNWLTLPALLGALVIAAAGAGLPGLGRALAGSAVALAVLFVPFCLGWLGAGDAKAAAVLGALFGAPVVLAMLWWMVLVGGLLALALLAAKGGLPDLLRRWGTSARLSLATRRPTYLGPEPGSPAAAGIPFALAMGLGATLQQLWGSPL
jgi:prepilin peptidase CpaA